MNFLPVENVDGELRSPFGVFTLPEGEREKLRDAPQYLVAGIRPEDFHDAATIDEERHGRGALLSAEVDVTEWLGNEVYAYLPFEAAPAVREALEELDRDLDGEGARTQVVAVLDPATNVQEGDTVDLWFDPAKVMVFDPETGENLTRDPENAKRLAAESEAARKRALDRAKAQQNGNGQSQRNGGIRADGEVQQNGQTQSATEA